MKISIKTSQLLLLFSLILVGMACKKEEEAMVPQRNWRVTYSVLAISDIEVNSITYLDEFGTAQTVPGDRNFSFSIEAETGFTARMLVSAEAINGGLVATIDAQSLDGALDNVVAREDGGHSGTEAQPVDVTVELRLP